MRLLEVSLDHEGSERKREVPLLQVSANAGATPSLEEQWIGPGWLRPDANAVDEYLLRAYGWRAFVEHRIEMLELEIGHPKFLVLNDLLDLVGGNLLERPQSLYLLYSRSRVAPRQIQAQTHFVDELSAEVRIGKHVLHVHGHLIEERVAQPLIH